MEGIDKMKRVGLDIGSTTVKAAIVGENNELLFGRYQRHFSDIRKTVSDIISEVGNEIPGERVLIAVTGSGGISVSKWLGIPFVQEVAAGTDAIRALAPQTDVAIELGGEDAKITYLTGGLEQRMNGSCAGGTGAFIDQMAALLNTDASGLNELAKEHTTIYPIASRCGVFAKSDIQPLITSRCSMRQSRVKKQAREAPSEPKKPGSAKRETWRSLKFSNDIGLGAVLSPPSFRWGPRSLTRWAPCQKWQLFYPDTSYVPQPGRQSGQTSCRRP